MSDMMKPYIEVGTLPRESYIGGPDAACVMNVSPYRTAVDCFFSKVDPQPEVISEEKRKFFRRRKHQEPIIAAMLEEEYGIVVTRLSIDEHPNRYQDVEYPFLAAEIDFEFLMSPSVRLRFPERPDFRAIPDGTLLAGEIKTVHPFSAHEWGEQGSEEVPTHYAAQVMHGLGITRRPAALVVALFGLDTLMAFPVMADQETIDLMRAECVKFWTENVLKRVPPDPVNLDDIKRLYTFKASRPCYLTDEVHRALVQMQQARDTINAMKGDISYLELIVAKHIANAWGKPLLDDDGKVEIEADEEAILYLGDAEVGSWKRQRGTYLDQKSLAADRPELVHAYTVEHHYRVLRLKKPKATSKSNRKGK